MTYSRLGRMVNYVHLSCQTEPIAMTGHLIVIRQGTDRTIHVAYRARLRETRSGARIAWLATFVPYLRYGMPTQFLALSVVESLGQTRESAG